MKVKDLKIGDCIKHGSNEYIVMTNADTYEFRFIKYKDKDTFTSIHESCEVTYIGSGKITYEYATSIEDVCKVVYTSLYKMFSETWFAIKHDSTSITIFAHNTIIEETMNNTFKWVKYPVKHVVTSNRLVN